MATFWEGAANSVYRMFSGFLLISHSGFEGGTFVLIASVPDHCLSFTFSDLVSTQIDLPNGWS